MGRAGLDELNKMDITQKELDKIEVTEEELAGFTKEYGVVYVTTEGRASMIDLVKKKKIKEAMK